METNNSPKDFGKFLQDNCSLRIERKQLFSLNNLVYQLFVQMPDQSNILVLEKDLRETPPTVHEALTEARSKFVRLPDGYTEFMTLLGPGSWANAIIRHPHFLTPLGFPQQLKDFVALADNVDSSGACVLFNPKDGSSNQKLYFACSDYGYSSLPYSFEEWIMAITDYWKDDPEAGPGHLYNNLHLTELHPAVRGDF